MLHLVKNETLRNSNTEKDLKKKCGCNPGDLLSITTKGFPGAHFAVFPNEIPEFFIKAACPPDGIVLDPFAGSGTTGEVARELGRKFILIELQPKYLAIIKERLRLNEQLPRTDESTSCEVIV